MGVPITTSIHCHATSLYVYMHMHTDTHTHLHMYMCILQIHKHVQECPYMGSHLHSGDTKWGQHVLMLQDMNAHNYVPRPTTYMEVYAL